MAYSQEYTIRHFGTDSGLQGNYVYTTAEGNKGYKWVGTDKGLSRFDGLNFEIINENDSTRMRFPTASLVTDDNSLWVGCYNGEIKKIRGSGLKAFKINSNPIVSITDDGHGVIWGLTQNHGVIRVDELGTNKLMPTELKGKKSNVILAYDDLIFIGTNEGLISYKYSSESHKLTCQGQIEALEGLPIHCLVKAKNDSFFWAGVDDQGLYEVTITNDTAVAVLNDFLQGKSIISIKETSEQELWLGTKYHGLIKINFNRDHIKPIQFTYINSKNGFPSDQISSLTLDKNENLWVGTVDQGLVQVFKKSIIFYDLNKYHVKAVNCISGNKKHEFLFGTDVGMIKGYYDNYIDSLKFEHISNKEVYKQNVTAIYTDSEGDIYFGIEEKGLYQSDVNFNQIVSIPFEHEKSKIRHITKDDQGLLWVSVMHQGVYVIDTLGNVKANYAIKTGFYHNEIYDIHIDNKGNKWFAAHSAGLAVMKQNGEIDYLTKEGTFPARDINDISEDENGNIWIGTYGNGIYEFDGQSFVRFDSENGLLNDYSNTIISDRNNHIWTGHRLGLSRIDENTNAVSTIEEKDGLSALEFIPRSVYRDYDHNIWLGNRNGITFLNTPDEMFQPKMLETLITDVKIDLKPVDLYKYTTEEVSADKVPQHMVFPYDRNNLTFEFLAINLRAPQSNLYQFKLEGYKSEWSPTTKINKASYTNLRPGKYVFMVRQSDNSDHWEDNITVLSFTISPSWWNTGIARTLFTLVILVIIGVLLRIIMLRKIRRLKKKQQYFKITENQNARLKNFAFITSHNTKSSVVNLMGLISILEQEPGNMEYFSLVKQTVHKLNRTIESIGELLDFENTIEKVKQTECSVLDIIECVVTLNNQSIEASKAKVQVDISKDLYVMAVPAYIESVFNNLITNAIRYGTTELEKEINIYAKSENKKVLVFVKDHGLGIDMDLHKEKLFELGTRFHSSHSDGQGLGLFMSKYQLEAMGGDISIESEVNKGTTVCVEFNAI